MSNLINLSFENQSVTTAIDGNGEILFRASELATALGFGNPRQAISTHVDNDDIQKLEIVCDVQELDGTSNKARKTQKVNFVNESGMYALIFGSTKDEAKRFKRWVTSEVLPSIRKTGTYRHTISVEQQAQIRQAVAKRCKSDSIHYQTLYAALHAHCGGVNSYHEILACDFDKALDFIHGYQFAPVVDAELYQVLTDCFEHIRDHARIAHLMSAPHATRINDTLNSIIHLAHTMALTNRHGRPMFERIGYEKRMNYYSGNALIMH